MTDNTQELDEILELLNRATVSCERSWITLADHELRVYEAKQAILDWRDREVASRAIEELEQIKRLSNGKFGKKLVFAGEGEIALQLFKIYDYSVDRIAKLKSEVEL